MTVTHLPQFIRDKLENQKQLITNLQLAIRKHITDLEKERIISRSLAAENDKLKKLLAAAQSV